MPQLNNYLEFLKKFHIHLKINSSPLMEAQAFNTPLLLFWPLVRVKSWGKMCLLWEQTFLMLGSFWVFFVGLFCCCCCFIFKFDPSIWKPEEHQLYAWQNNFCSFSYSNHWSQGKRPAGNITAIISCLDILKIRKGRRVGGRSHRYSIYHFSYYFLFPVCCWAKKTLHK